MKSTSNQKAGNYHHGNLAEALVSAALELMSEGGVEALTLRAAARRAGVSPAAPYRHFQDKAELLAAVAMHGFLLLRQKMEEALQLTSGDPLQGIRLLGITYVRFAVENAAHFRVMFGPEIADRERFPELEAIAKAVMQLQADRITECQKLGMIRDTSNLELGLATWTAMHGCASLLLAQQIPPDLSEEAYVGIVGETILIGLLRQ